MKALGGTIFSLFLAILCSRRLYFLSVDATSILRPGDELNSTWNLVSDGGNFTLGFFTIAVNYTYIGIWYTGDIDSERRVWVGNPNTPLINNISEVLTIDSSGTLKIINGGNTVFNISNHTGTSNTSAILEDSGNFVLVDAVDNRTLWQSFDHPTNTLLPGMRLGFNRTTGENRTLVSWLSYNIPASGAFTLGLESIQGSGQLVIRLRGELYWTSGSWNNQNFQFTSFLTEPFNLYKYNLSFISDTDAMYFTFDIFGETTAPLLVLSWDGQIRQGDNMVVNPYENDFCYGYESDNGCVASPLPTCRSSSDAFTIKRGDFRGPGISITYDDNSNLSLADCMERCWNDCSCNSFVVNSNGTGCIIWSGNGDFFLDETGNSVQKYVLVSEKSSKGKSWI